MRGSRAEYTGIIQRHQLTDLATILVGDHRRFHAAVDTFDFHLIHQAPHWLTRAIEHPLLNQLSTHVDELRDEQKISLTVINLSFALLADLIQQKFTAHDQRAIAVLGLTGQGAGVRIAAGRRVSAILMHHRARGVDTVVGNGVHSQAGGRRGNESKDY